MKQRFHRIKQAVACLLCFIFTVSATVYGETTQEKLDQASSEIDRLNREKEEKQGELSDIKNYKTGLSGELAGLNDELQQISDSLDELQQQIDEQNENISNKEAEIKKQQKKCEKQYEDMKKRIQYSYEHSQESMLSILFQAESFSDFLNRTEYVQAITEYDRNMLDEYQNTLAAIKQEKENLVAEREKLTDLQGQMQDKEDQVQTLVSDKQEKIKKAEQEITDAEAAISDYNAQIEKQQAYEEELEQQKAKEDAARLAEIRRQEEAEKAKIAQTTVKPAAGDEALLAALIECEAGGESYDGMLAVGSVVLNRVASGSFPNSVVGVIYQSGQFSPVASGRFANVLAKGAGSASVQAAKEVLGGRRTISALYFRRNTGLIEGTVIGNHVFY